MSQETVPGRNDSILPLRNQVLWQYHPSLLEGHHRVGCAYLKARRQLHCNDQAPADHPGRTRLDTVRVGTHQNRQSGTAVGSYSAVASEKDCDFLGAVPRRGQRFYTLLEAY